MVRHQNVPILGSGVQEQGQEQADLGVLIKFILRGLRVALPLGLLAAAAVYFASQQLEPTFAAEATILSTRATGSAAELSTPPVEASAYGAIAKTRPVLADALARVGASGALPEDFADTVSVDIEGGREDLSHLIYIRVQAASPQVAARRANALAQALVAWDWRRSSQSIGQRIQTLEEQIAALDDSVESLRLMGEVAQQSEIDDRISLRAQQQEELFYTRALLDSAAGLLSVVEPAAPDPEPVAPRPLFNAALAAIFAFFLVYGVALLRSALDTRMPNADAVGEATGLPVLAEFPESKNALLAKEAADYFQARLLLATVSRTPFHHQGPRVVLVTSPKSEEGKTTVSVQLAESLARHGHRTLLVDADLRRPAIAKHYRISPDHDSLSDYLETPEGRSPTQVEVSGGTLDVVPNFRAGAPAQLSRRLPACIEQWRDYDVVILDSAPLLPVADSFALAPLCTHTVLVANLKRSDRRSVKSAAERLEAMGVTLAGVAVTQVKGRLEGRQYRRYLQAGAE